MVWWKSQLKEAPVTVFGKANFLSDHWFEFRWNPLDANSESSSGVAGAGESEEDVENEEA